MTARTELRRYPRLAAAAASPWVPAVLAATSLAVSLLVQHAIYPGLSWNRDEPVYLWQVDVLRSGQLTAPDGGFPDLLRPWLSAARDGALFSQYTLGWPLVLTAGALLGDPGLGAALGAPLCVVGTWLLVLELTRDRAVATASASLVVVSPFFVVQSGLYLSYVFTLGLGLLFLAASFSGVRLRSRPRLLAAGLLLGWIVLTRPFDAIVWGSLAWVPIVIEHRRHLRDVLRQALPVAVGALPLVVGTLWVNHRLTGSATQFPITAADPLDRFGFGDRRLMPGFAPIDYGPRLAATSTARNLFWLPLFLVGAHLGVLLAGWTAWRCRTERAVRLLIALGLAFPVSYFAFFGTHISSLTARISSPIYYLPTYIPLCALVALALVRTGRRNATAAVLTGVVLVLVTVPIAADRLRLNRELSRANQPWAESVQSLDGPSLVITSPPAYLLYLNPFGHNAADLTGAVLYASDRGPEVIELLRAHPHRAPYWQRASLPIAELQPSEHPKRPRVELTPLQLIEGDARITGSVRRPAGASHAVWWIEVDGQPVSPHLSVGPAAAVDVRARDLPVPDGLHTIDVLVAPGSTATSVAGAQRQRFYLERRRDVVSLLSPGTSARLEIVGRQKILEWVGMLDLDALSLRVTA